MRLSHWLLKSEPETYSFEQLQKDKKTNWNGIRNFQARNFLRTVQKGDLALIYHSGDQRAVVGIARVIAEAYPDLDPNKKGDWVQIDLEPVQPFHTPVTLAEIKANSHLSDLLLLKQSRLSVMPMNRKHFEIITKMGEKK
jgi:predicted RNA-binding protein with PUA-like domain